MPIAGSVIRVGLATYRDPGRACGLGPAAGREEEKVLFMFSGLA